MKYIVRGLDTEDYYSCITYEDDDIINHIRCIDGEYHFTTFKPGASFSEYKNFILTPFTIYSDMARSYDHWKKINIHESSKMFNIKTKVIIHDMDGIEIPIGTRLYILSINNEISSLLKFRIEKCELKDTAVYDVVYLHTSNLSPFIMETIE